ncbi:Heme-binding protein 2 [Exaiptasia diaphana]|nr:Heme-binding protein 2 [Exaiptasia diaphana]
MFGWFKGEEKPPIDPKQFHIPEFYRGTNGPLIKVLETHDDYEVRLYEKTQWVSSKSPPGEFMGAFWRLYSYIGGKNDQGKKMDMNMPVRMYIKLSEEDEDGSKVDDFVVSFFLSSSLLPELPKPTDEQVFLEQEERRVTYVANFSGMATGKDWKDSRKRLMAALDRDGKRYVAKEYFSAGYDPPYKLWNRRNEMILIADPQPELDEDDWFKGEEKPKKDTSEFHYPDFYNGSIGPRFKLLDSDEDYETRIYESTKWVSTDMETSDYGDAMSKGFWKLFGYIGGKNETKSKVAMTIPVRGTVTQHEGETKSVVTSFFVDQSKDCPAPTEETVFVKEESEEVKVYVRNFGGFAKDHSYKENLQALKDSLDRDGKCYVTGVYFTAGYDPPFKLWGRRNEVYVQAASENTD